MLQVDVCPFASDALEDAMRLAQTKALNSYTFSDCINFLNYVWSDIYSQICCIDSGYYSKTVQLTQKLTKLPRFVKNSVMIYSAQSQMDHNRKIYQQMNNMEMLQSGMYLISGTDLWCPDAERGRRVWLEYCPQPAQIFFTHHNRDPKIYPDGHESRRECLYNLYKLVPQEFVVDTVTIVPNGVLYTYDDISKAYIISHDMQRVAGKTYYKPKTMFNGRDISDMTITQDQIASVKCWVLKHRNISVNIADNDISTYINRDADENGHWELRYISCDFPYIFCSYRHNVTSEWASGFFDKNMEWTDYNPFEWLGRNDNVEYITCNYNDKTGLGVIVNDWSDLETHLLNTEHLPEVTNSVIYVENYFEYKASDNTAFKMTQGYWYNRYATDYNYEKVPVVTVYPSDPDDGDVINLNGVLYRFETTGNTWNEVQNIEHIAQAETKPKVKELGWTPDTKLVYPAPEVYRYLVARLAEKFSALNESNIMGVQSELADAKFAFQAFLKKDKSAWERMRNVNPATVTDWL